jgi:hypothetical protein
MSIVDICQMLQDMGPATSLRESQFMFPLIEGSHLLGLALMMAPVLMFDLRLLGVLWKKEPASEIRNQFMPITVAGGLLMVSTGVLLFWSEAVKCYNSTYFRVKVVMLILATINVIIFHSTIDRRINEWENDSPPPSRAKLAGIMSILLWTGVIFAGRYTAYNL